MTKLNKIIDEITLILSQEKAYDLPIVCNRYGLENGDESEAFQSKRIYVQRRLKGKGQLFLLDLSKRIIDDFGEEAKNLSKLVFNMSPHGIFLISEITRKNIMNELYSNVNIWGEVDIITFLKRIWNLDSMPSTDNRFENASGDIWQHMVNNDDYDEKYLFEEYLELLTANDELFVRFLEQLVHPIVRGQSEQQKYVDFLNKHLINDGYKIAASGHISGYPIYKVHKIQEGVKGTVKNLIFAAIGAKPRIVISDSLNNDIRIVKNEDKCLVYENSIPTTGLFWKDLVSWWGTINSSLENTKEIQISLYNRLRNSLDSKPERIFFKSYFILFNEKYKENLPALIPQVYLHYDPYTRSQRNGEVYLPRQRMDFLIILPNKQRVVIEIDGKQHYSIGDTSSPKKYAEMVSADRDLKLHGYEVYRFGGYELMDEENSLALLRDFFKDLFDKHDIKQSTLNY
jgi:AbiJ N-terminal domain 3